MGLRLGILWRWSIEEVPLHLRGCFGAGPRFCPGRQLAMMEIKRSWLCCAPNFVAGLFFGLNLFEDHPNVEDQMARERASVRVSIRSLCYAFIL
jgi:Cytochrome P450